MQRKSALSALVIAAAFAGNAFAESPTIDTTPFVSSKSRAEVQADLAAYKKEGVDPWSMTYDPLKHFRSATTRQAVTAEYIAARAEVNAFTGEDSGSSYLAQHRGHDDRSMIAGQPAPVR